jgi:hypothetical protein
MPAAFFLAIELHPLAWLGWESGIDEGEKRQQPVARSLRLGSIASWERAGHLLPQPQLVPGGCGSRQAGRIICGAQRSQVVLRLPVFMDLYIHPLYVLVSKILSSILNSSTPIHPLYHPLSTLSTVGSTCHFI